MILWDVAHPERPHRLGQPLTGHTERVYSVAFAPDGRTLATASDDTTVILWGIAHPERPHRLGQPLTAHTGTVSSVAFSGNGHTLAAAGNTMVILWDLTEPEHPRRLGPSLTAHIGTALSVAFSPDGRTLATAGQDRTAILWDLTSFNYLRDHAAERACSITRGGLDRDEWDRYVPGLPYQDTCPN